MFENSEKRDYVRVADSAPLTTETVDARGDGALVGEIPRDPTFVFGSGPTDESRVEYQTILGGVPLRLEGSGMRQRRGGEEEASVTSSKPKHGNGYPSKRRSGAVGK